MELENLYQLMGFLIWNGEINLFLLKIIDYFVIIVWFWVLVVNQVIKAIRYVIIGEKGEEGLREISFSFCTWSWLIEVIPYSLSGVSCDFWLTWALQHWIKDEKYSTRVKDEEGLPSFALINKATGQAMKHSIGATHPVCWAICLCEAFWISFLCFCDVVAIIHIIKSMKFYF